MASTVFVPINSLYQIIVQYACPSVYVRDTVGNKAKIIILLYFYYRTGAFVSRGRTTKERAWPTIIIYIYIIMPNTHIILLHAAAAGIYLRDFDRISPSVYGGRRSQRKRMLTLLTSIVIIRKKTYQNETKIANTRDSYDRRSVTELRRREKKIILVIT